MCDTIPHPQNEAAQNPAACEGTHIHGNRSFRCADAVERGCGWSVTGNNEEEILGYLRAHARQAHGKNEFTPKELENARRAIHNLRRNSHSRFASPCVPAQGSQWYTPVHSSN